MSRLDPSDTIAAIASPPGPGLRGIVRLSGPEAWAVALDGFEREAGGDPPAGAGRWVGGLRVDGLRSPLPVALSLGAGPRTYTGQDSAEIHAPGSPPILRQLLAHCLARGARSAEPGEFTLRAFLSGRIDLTQSEAVLGVIDARTPAQLDAALRQLAGGLASPIRALRDHLADILAHLEANLDFADEPDVDPIGREVLARSLDTATAAVEALAVRLRGRDRPEGRPRVVLVGPPNVGKSRLFNALIGADRAIVSPQAGTTRDYLEAVCDCDGLSVSLVDTAGREEASGAIAARAQAVGGDQAEAADLLLDCRTAGLSIAELPRDRPRLIVWTKADAMPPASGDSIATSAATGFGLAALRSTIKRAIASRDSEGDAPAGTAARCGDSLARSGRSLDRAAVAIRSGMGDELVAIDIRQGLDDLGEVVGAVVADDLLDRIFRRFCIGK